MKQFIEKAIFQDPHVDFVVIQNGSNPIRLPSYVTLINRANKGYDFGAWSEALLADNRYRRYDKFIFINSSATGPSVGGRWTDKYVAGIKGSVKLFGSTINAGGGLDPVFDPLTKSHVQTYAFCLDKVAVRFLIQKGIFSLTNHPASFHDCILEKEILMSRLILDHGWNIGSLLPMYKGVDFRFKSKMPEDYGIEFRGDIMHDQYRSLWKKEDLVFIKGNRIDCYDDCKI